MPIFGRNPFRRQQTVYDEVVCPYCFHRCRNDNVLFRAPDTLGVESDEKLDEFWKSTTGKSAGKKGKVVVPNPAKGERKEISFTDSNGVIHKMLSGYTPVGSRNVIQERICPECHNTLPSSAGNGNSTVVAVVGYTQIGKTIFINSLITALRGIVKKFPYMTFKFTDMSMLKTYNEINQKIRDGKLEPTDVKFVEPIIVQLTNNNDHSSTIITFYDFPGEAQNEHIKKFCKNQIDNADGLLVLFDLTQSETLGDSFIRLKIERQKLKKKKLVDSLGINENIVYSIVDLTSSVDLAKLTSLQKDIEKAEMDLRKVKAIPIAADATPIVIQRRDSEVKKYETQIAEKTAQLAKAKEDVDAVMKKAEELFGKPLTQSIIQVLNSIARVSKSIDRLEEDRKHPQSRYVESTNSYEHILTTDEWFSVTLIDSIGGENAVQDKRPVAVVGTKSDEVVSMYEYDCIDDEDIKKGIAMLNQEPVTKSVFNSGEADRISAFVERQLLAEDLNFKGQLENAYINKSYFAVSALGSSYNVEESIDANGNFVTRNVLSAHNIKPWRVDEPLLWILHKLGVIN